MNKSIIFAVIAGISLLHSDTTRPNWLTEKWHALLSYFVRKNAPNTYQQTTEDLQAKLKIIQEQAIQKEQEKKEEIAREQEQQAEALGQKELAKKKNADALIKKYNEEVEKVKKEIGSLNTTIGTLTSIKEFEDKLAKIKHQIDTLDAWDKEYNIKMHRNAKSYRHKISIYHNLRHVLALAKGAVHSANERGIPYGNSQEGLRNFASFTVQIECQLDNVLSVNEKTPLTHEEVNGIKKKEEYKLRDCIKNMEEYKKRDAEIKRIYAQKDIDYWMTYYRCISTPCKMKMSDQDRESCDKILKPKEQEQERHLKQ